MINSQHTVGDEDVLQTSYVDLMRSVYSQHRRLFIFLSLFLIIFYKCLQFLSYGKTPPIDLTRSYLGLEQPSPNIAEILQFIQDTPPPYKYVWNQSSSSHTHLPQRRNKHTHSIDCPAMFSGNNEAIGKAKEYMQINPKPQIEPEEYTRLTRNCSSFKQDRGYYSEPFSKEEYEYPIAFSILMYKGVQQVERLLRSIYHPQNFYCIHVDEKAKIEVRQAMMSIANCFPNVFIPNYSENVYWGHISMLYAEMRCMRTLLPYRWKYFINLSGQMFPLHSNGELVKILKLYDGANDIEGSFSRGRALISSVRQIFHWRHVRSINMMMPTLSFKSSPPHNVTICKGSNQIAVTREFVAYFLYSKQSWDLMEYFKDTLAPDEYVWPTINHNPNLGAPGAYKGDPETKKFTVRATIWSSIADQVNWSWDYWQCQGRWKRMICIFGVGDLPWLYQRPELFANKFHEEFEWLAYDCLEDLIHNRTLERTAEYFDTSYHQGLPFVQNKDSVVIYTNQ